MQSLAWLPCLTTLCLPSFDTSSVLSFGDGQYKEVSPAMLGAVMLSSIIRVSPALALMASSRTTSTLADQRHVCPLYRRIWPWR